MPPIIAITAKTEELRNRPQTTIPVAYAKAIEDAGGIPVILPIINQKANITSIAQYADGFLFSGGDDIHPKYYGEEPLLDLELSPDERTDFEMALLIEVMRLKKPVLGICLGAQLINVAHLSHLNPMQKFLLKAPISVLKHYLHACVNLHS